MGPACRAPGKERVHAFLERIARRSPELRPRFDLFSERRTTMNRICSRFFLAALLVAPLGGSGLLLLAAQAEPLDAARIGQAAETKATTTKDGVVRLAWSRTDVKVTVDGLAFPPAAGLGSWAAFTPAKHGAMVMGDTVVFQDEVTPAIDAAFAAGLEITGLHNHFFYDEPKVYFMHIGGHGDPEKLATAVKGVWDAIKKVRGEQSTPATRFVGTVPAPGTITPGPLEK